VGLASLRRRIVLLALTASLLVPLAPLAAQTDAGWLTQRMDEWYHRAQRSSPGDWGIAIADQSGQVLWSVDPDGPLMPASTVKLFTPGFARSVLGGTARRPTRIVGVGSLDSASGEWIGSWALEVNGDPSLERAEGSGPTLYDLAMQLAGSGVRRLTGPLQLQSSNGPADAVYPAVWSIHHQGRIFAPLVGPLTLHENVVWITVLPGARVGQRPRVSESKTRRANVPRPLDKTTAAKRQDARQKSAKVVGGAAVDHRLDRAVLILGDEDHVEQTQHPPALQSIDLGQHPILEVRTGTKAHGNHLQRTGHHSTSPSALDDKPTKHRRAQFRAGGQPTERHDHDRRQQLRLRPTRLTAISGASQSDERTARFPLRWTVLRASSVFTDRPTRRVIYRP